VFLDNVEWSLFNLQYLKLTSFYFLLQLIELSWDQLPALTHAWDSIERWKHLLEKRLIQFVFLGIVVNIIHCLKNLSSLRDNPIKNVFNVFHSSVWIITTKQLNQVEWKNFKRNLGLIYDLPHIYDNTLHYK